MDKPRRLTVLEISKHPLVVLAVTTLIGSIAIPFVNARITQANRQKELRSSYAMQALRSGFETDRRLNLLLTEFEMFVKDELTDDSGDWNALRERAVRLYADFNRDAWWWYWELLRATEVLDLVDEASIDTMRAAIDDYEANLRRSAEAIDPVWALLKPVGAAEREVRSASSVFALSVSESRDLRETRQEIVGRMVAPLIE
jgi:hypothetical protein